MGTNTFTRYLLAIYQLSDGGRPVRSIDVARLLSVSRSSVSKTLLQLAAHGLVDKAYYGAIHLTPKGTRAANRCYTEYAILLAFFRDLLGCGPAAEADALRCVLCLSPAGKGRLADLVLRQNGSADPLYASSLQSHK